MRTLLLAWLLVPILVPAQDTAAFARAVNSGKVQRVDRWMKRELHRQRKGHPVMASSGTYIDHDATYDSLVAFLRRQPGMEDAEWDRCVGKLDIWPGHSTIGLRVSIDGKEHERCYRAQEGIPGTIRLFGWRPHVRKDREQLKFLSAAECPGFVAEQRRYCRELRR